MGQDAPPRHPRPVQSRAMTSTRLWDRAAAPPALPDGRRRPQVAVLPTRRPGLADLFDFMRDAELRFATLLMRIEDRTRTARGTDVTSMEVVLRHPGDAKVTTTRQVDGPIGEYETWKPGLSIDGPLDLAKVWDIETGKCALRSRATGSMTFHAG